MDGSGVLHRSGIVYSATNRLNGKLYVGSTTQTIEQRRLQHLREAAAGSTTAFKVALRRFGPDNFTWNVIEKVVLGPEAPRRLEERERYWALVLGALVPNGYTSQVFLHSTEAYLVAQAEGIRRRSKDPVWVRHHAEALAKINSDPAFQRMRIGRSRAAAATPEWQEQHRQHLARVNSNPETQRKVRYHLDRLNADPIKRKNDLERLARLRADPTVRARNVASYKRWVTSPDGSAKRRRVNELLHATGRCKQLACVNKAMAAGLMSSLSLPR